MVPISIAKRTLWLIVVSLLVVPALLIGGCATDTADKPTIDIVQFPVDYCAIQARVMQLALEERGYLVNIHEQGAMGLVYLGLAEGDYDIYPDAWMPVFHAPYFEEHADKIDYAGNLYGSDLPTGWVVPRFVVDEYGIASMADLKDHKDLFDGRVYGYEAGTGGMMLTEESAEVYGMEDWEIIYGTVPTLMAEVYWHYDNNEPIVYCGWRPHPSMADMDLVFLEDPENVFGTNYVTAGYRKALEEEAPEVVNFISNQVVPVDVVEHIMAHSEDQIEVAVEMAEEWYEENRDLVESWWK